MEYVSIQIPAALYAKIYGLYEEESSTVILRSLNQLTNEEQEKTKVHETPKDVITDFTTLQPKAGTITAKVWDIANRIFKEAGVITHNHRDLVIQACIQQGLKANTASTKYSDWKKVHR